MVRRFQYLSTCVYLCFSALVATTTLGAQPYAYVANNGGNTVAVINMSTYTVSATLPVPATPSGIAVTPDGSTAYVSSSYNNNVSAIRTSDNTIVATIPVGTNPTRLAISPNGALVYVVDYVTNQISVINHNTKTVVATIGVGFRPTFVAFSPDSTRAYVTNLFSSTVSVIDTGSNLVINTFPTGSFPTGVAVTADGLHLYVSNQGTNAVTVHDPAGNVQATIAGFVAPNAVAIAPNGKVFVTNGNGAAVSVIDPATNTVIAKPSVGSLPTSVAISTNGTQALVANEYGFTVSVIDTSSYAVTHTVSSVGVYPMVVGMQPPAPAGGGGGCTVTPSLATGNSLAFGSGGGTATINVQASAPNCTWSVVGTGFATLTPSGTSGNGTVTVTAGANASTSSLSESFTVANQPFTVTESGISCTYGGSVTAGSLSFGSSGGSATITVTAPQGCSWTPSGPSFVTLTPSVTSGNGTVAVSAGANASHLALNGTITIAAGVSFAVSETGVACSYSLSGSTSAPATAGTGSVTVTAPAGCTWTSSDVVDPWLTTSSTGTGNGTASYSYTANPSTGSRTGTMTIGGQPFSVTQAGVGFSPIRLNAGGPAFTDLNGNAWLADTQNGGNYTVTGATITDPGGKFTTIYQRSAFAGTTGLSYTFTVPNGTFSVTLHFAETYETASNRRLMNVSINGAPVATSLDVFAQALGANIAYSPVYSTTVTNGQITITIMPAMTGSAVMLSGIEIQ